MAKSRHNTHKDSSWRYPSLSPPPPQPSRNHSAPSIAWRNHRCQKKNQSFPSRWFAEIASRSRGFRGRCSESDEWRGGRFFLSKAASYITLDLCNKYGYSLLVFASKCMQMVSEWIRRACGASEFPQTPFWRTYFAITWSHYDRRAARRSRSDRLIWTSFRARTRQWLWVPTAASPSKS